jgi:restriction system protein
MPRDARFPTSSELCWSTVEALQKAHTAMSNEDIEAFICHAHTISEDVRAALHQSGPRTELGYRAAWARTVLRKRGLIERAGRAAWRLTSARESISGVQHMREVLRRPPAAQPSS